MIYIAIGIWIALGICAGWLYAERQAHADTRRELWLWRSEALGLRRELAAERNRDTTADTVDQWLREQVRP